MRSIASIPDYARRKARTKRKPEQAEYQRWVQAVGETRARAAMAAKQVARMGWGKPTLIELLTEAFLKERNVAYETQIDLGFARPDFVLFNTQPSQVNTCVAWLINGEYWHKSRYWHDYGKGKLMINVPVNGMPIVDVIAIWEADVMQGDAVFAEALRGERRRD
jgi:hypothetical protein